MNTHEHNGAANLFTPAGADSVDKAFLHKVPRLSRAKSSHVVHESRKL